MASLGATTFIVFTIPSSYTSQSRNVIGGYIVGIIIGIIFHLLSLEMASLLKDMSIRVIYIFLGSIAVGITILLMTITNTEHPPAVGMSLGLVLSKWSYITIMTILFCVVFMWLVKILLVKKDLLIDLK
nr:HPP family protein [Thermohalobacter berrensis]